MKFGLLLLLLSQNAYALECDGIPEGQVVRIDKGSGSLANAAVQDQDGLGSCFANQASLLLQSAIPGNPNLSYLNLGIYYTNDKIIGQQRTQSSPSGNIYTVDQKRTDGSMVREAGSAITSGFPCKTIDAALARQKKTGIGSLCKAEDVYLEHSFLNKNNSSFEDPNHIQEKSLLHASRYMNSYQKRFGFSFENADSSSLQTKREAADKFSLALRNFVRNTSDNFMSQKCSKQDNDKAERIFSNTLIRAMNAHPACLDRASSNKDPVCKSFDQLGFVIKSSGVNSRVNFLMAREIRENLFRSLPAMYTPQKGFDGFLTNVLDFYKKNDKSTNTPAQKAAFIRAISSAISPEDKRELENDYKRIALKQIDECKAENVLSYFKDKKEFLEKAKKDSVLCNYSELLERASDLAGVMPSKTFNDMSAFVDFITAKAGLNYDDALLNLMAKDCSPDKRVLIPENLRCNPVRVSMDSSELEGDALSPRVAQMVKTNRSKMMDSLARNRGVGLDICTRFWGEPGFDMHKKPTATKFQACAETGKHSFHAITMIGYRCKNNKMEYLAQNSWGPNWKLPGYETENGKIWLDEDKLFKNLDNINYLSQ